MTVAGTASPASYDLQAFYATDPRQSDRVAGSSTASASSWQSDSFSTSGTLVNPIAVVAAGTAGAAASASALQAVSTVQFQTGLSNGFGSGMGSGLGNGFGNSFGSGMGNGFNNSFGSSAGYLDDGFGVMSRGMGNGFGRASLMNNFDAPFASTSGRLAARFQTFSEGVSAMRAGLGMQVGIGTAIGAVVSLANNVYGAIKGRISPGEAAGNVATDTVTAGISATSGAVVGGLATAAIGAMGVAGLPLTLVGLGAAVAGGIAADVLFRKTSVARTIHDTVANLFNRAVPNRSGPPVQPAV